MKLLPKGERWEFERSVTSAGNFMHVSASASWDAEDAEAKGWPPHAPRISVIPQETIAMVRNDPFMSQQEKDLFDYLDKPETFAECERVHPRMPPTKLALSDVEIIVTTGLFEYCSNPVGAGYLFDVREYTKKRRRLVHDSLTPNVMLPDAPNPHFRTVPELRAMVHKGRWAASLDMKCFYYQFLLHPSVRRYFAIEIDGVFYQPTRLPMGFKASVSIAQAFIKSMVRLSGVPLGDTDIYIDNIMVIADTEEECRRRLDLIHGTLLRAGVVVGDIQQPARQVVHRGMKLDMEAKTASIKPEFIQKLEERIVMQQGIWGHTRSLIGMMTYALQVLDVPLGSIFHVFKYWARNVETNVKKKVTMWAEAATEWETAMQIIRRNTPTRVQETVPVSTFVITDASIAGGISQIGGIIIQNGMIRYFSERGLASKDIATLETVAVLRAYDKWSTSMKKNGVWLMIDNQVTLAGLARGLSRNHGVNGAVLQILRKIKRDAVDVRLFYVASADNPADVMTRPDKSFSENHLSMLTQLRRWSTLREPGRVEGLTQFRKLFVGSNLPVFVWGGG